MQSPFYGKAIKLYLGAFILLVTGIGSILATNIVVTSSNKGQEFGQGEYRIAVCDSWITLDLVEGATGSEGAPDGYSPLTGITVQGLDVKQCAKTKFQIGVVDSHGNSLPLFRTDGLVRMCGSEDCLSDEVSTKMVSLSIDAQGNLALEPQDQYHSLFFDSKAGSYQIRFNQPGILAKDVSRLTIQSENA